MDKKDTGKQQDEKKTEQTTKAEDVKAPQDAHTGDDLALLAAWRRLLDYDRVSTTEKSGYQRLRGWVITLSFLTASLAVFSTLKPNVALGFTVRPTLTVALSLAFLLLVFAFLIPEIRRQWRISQSEERRYGNIALWTVCSALLMVLVYLNFTLDDEGIVNLMRVTLVILPIASVGMMNYANSFSTSVTWVEYRASAEEIRSNIYLYRMRAGAYREEDAFKRQRALLDVVHSADRRIADNGATVPYKQEMEASDRLKDRIIKKARETIDKMVSEDERKVLIAGDGLRTLTIDEYIAWRIYPQINWYVDRIRNDYEAKRRDRIYALVIAGGGAVISALGYGLEGLVAITTASAVALGQRSDIFMYGATYGLFHTTSTHLQNALNLWRINPPENKTNAEEQRAFVEKCEDIFAEERELWREQSIQMQQMAEQALQNSVQGRRQPGDANGDKPNSAG